VYQKALKIAVEATELTKLNIKTTKDVIDTTDKIVEQINLIASGI
jgi:hypothetical protein